MKSGNQLSKFYLAALCCLSILALVGRDFLHVQGADEFKNGQARYLFLALVPILGTALWGMNRAWALFWSLSAFSWILCDWAPHGMLDVLLIGGCLALGHEIQERFKAYDVLTVLASLATLQAVYGLFQWQGIDPFFSTKDEFFWNRPIGSIGHFTLLGPFVGIGATIFFARGLRYWQNAIPFAVCCACIAVCDSTMAVLGTAAGLWYVLMRREFFWAFALLSPAAVGMFAAWMFWPTAEFFSFTGRLSVWPAVVEAWSRAPLFGHGPGSWFGYYGSWNLPVLNTRWDQAHNDFLQVLPEQGLAGFALVLGGLVLAFRSFQKQTPELGAIAMLIAVTALGSFPLHIPCFGLIAGWIASMSENTEPKGTL